MKAIKTITAVCLLTATACAFAKNEEAKPTWLSVSCPPSSALHHTAVGKPWTLDEDFKSNGWYVMQKPEMNWNRDNSLPKDAVLAVSVMEESVVDNFAHKTNPESPTEKIFRNEGKYFYPVTCAYYYPDASGSSAAVIVKSSYESGPQIGTPNFVYFNQGANVENVPEPTKPVEANWGYVCNTNAAQPEKCKLDVIDPTVPYVDDVPPFAKLKPSKK